MRSATLRVLLVLSIAASVAPAQRIPQPPIAFRIGFWNNLHLFLYVLGRAQNRAPDARREAVVKAPAELEALAGRTDAERRGLASRHRFLCCRPIETGCGVRQRPDQDDAGTRLHMKPVLDQYWEPYLRGEGTIDEALASVITHLQ